MQNLVMMKLREPSKEIPFTQGQKIIQILFMNIHDFYSFQSLVLIVCGTGVFFAILFHVGVEEVVTPLDNVSGKPNFQLLFPSSQEIMLLQWTAEMKVSQNE